MTKFKFVAILISILTLTTSFSSLAAYILDKDGKGFTWEFKGSEHFKNPGDFSGSLINDRGIQTRKEPFITLNNSTVEVILNTFFDSKNQDFIFYNEYKAGGSTGLYCSTLSCFMVSLNKSNFKYIDWVEIDWIVDYELSDAQLSLYGTSKKFFASSADTLTYSKDSEFQLYAFRPESNRTVRYKIDKPVISIALFANTVINNNPEHFIQFSAFRVHFSETEPVPSTDVNVQFGDGTEATHDISWSNKSPIELTHMISLPEGTTAEELGLKFYITPDFPIVGKPDPQGERPDDISGPAWRLFSYLDQNTEHKYDGYISSADPIECQYKETDEGIILTVDAPCSGLYKLIAVSENPQYNVTYNEFWLNVWSDIRNTYEWLAALEPTHNVKDPIYYFGINYINFDSPESETLAYPYDPVFTNEPFSKANGIIHIPGLYNYKLYYKWDNESMNNLPSEVNAISSASAVDADDELSGYNDASVTPLHLTNLGTATESLNLRIAKNGSLTPASDKGSETRFLIQLTDSKTYDEALGVEELREENDLQAEYFTLDGLKVNPDSYVRGILIEKRGSKTRKIFK